MAHWRNETHKMKSLLIFLLLVAVSTCLYAQQNFNFGFRGGLNYTNNVLVTDESSLSDENEYRVSYHVGIISSIELTDKFSVSPELLFPVKDTNLKEIQTLIQVVMQMSTTITSRFQFSST